MSIFKKGPLHLLFPFGKHLSRIYYYFSFLFFTYVHIYHDLRFNMQ